MRGVNKKIAADGRTYAEGNETYGELVVGRERTGNGRKRTCCELVNLSIYFEKTRVKWREKEREKRVRLSRNSHNPLLLG